MRVPRLESILQLTAELIIVYVIVMFMLDVMESMLISQGWLPSIDSTVDKVITYFAGMLGAVGVLVCGTVLTVSETFEKKKE